MKNEVYRFADAAIAAGAMLVNFSTDGEVYAIGRGDVEVLLVGELDRIDSHQTMSVKALRRAADKYDVEECELVNVNTKEVGLKLSESLTKILNTSDAQNYSRFTPLPSKSARSEIKVPQPVLAEALNIARFSDRDVVSRAVRIDPNGASTLITAADGHTLAQVQVPEQTESHVAICARQLRALRKAKGFGGITLSQGDGRVWGYASGIHVSAPAIEAREAIEPARVDKMFGESESLREVTVNAHILRKALKRVSMRDSVTVRLSAQGGYIQLGAANDEGGAQISAGASIKVNGASWTEFVDIYLDNGKLSAALKWFGREEVMLAICCDRVVITSGHKRLMLMMMRRTAETIRQGGEPIRSLIISAPDIDISGGAFAEATAKRFGGAE